MLDNLLNLLGRAALALVFIPAGFSKIGAYEATAGYMDSVGVPGALLPLVILLEIAGGLAVLLGILTRPAALALATFSVAAAVIFHADFGDQVQSIMFAKNIGLAGGFLVLASQAPAAWSVDAIWRR